ncbi:MAG: sugar ABC transporter permease [Bifidobacteriaceae bacterium]|jgi:raffinose/stachyose/melibiose transport system permease protein|nr:sugar ABC transporter permease [Bifidobacteriaceae bacterium]
MPTGTALAFALPAMVLFAVLVLYPLATALSYSFFNWRGIVRDGWAGLDNYVALFTQLPYKTDLPRAFAHNLMLFVGAMVFQNTVGLALAQLLHRLPHFKRLFQTLFTMPYLVSPLVIGYLWTLLLSPLFGPVNAALKALGLDALALPWLGDPHLAIWVIVFINSWQWIGFPVLLYGAAMGGIPDDLEEAAALDGANAWQKFWRVTFPLLTPAIGTVTVLTFIGAMEAFAIPYAVGGSLGNPAKATDVLSLLFYRTAFQSGSTNSNGISSAVAMLLFAFIFGVAVVVTGLMRRWERKLT